MSMKRLLSAVIFATLLFSACTTQPGQAPQSRVYRIGYMICNSEQETLHRFRPLTAYLSKQLGVRFEIRAIDTTDFTREADKLDFTHTNSLLYIIMHRNQGVDILAAEKSGSLGARGKGLIVALKKSGLTSVRQLKGKTMVFGPMLGPTSYMAQLDMLLKSKIDPENDLAVIKFSPPKGTKLTVIPYGDSS